MAWNEPGGNKDRDPWGGGGRGRGRDNPPDLDEALRKLQDRMRGWFGGGGGDSDGQRPRRGMSGPGPIIGLAVAAWLLSGIYIVDPAERGVIMRFGRYVETTLPGPHWRWPFPIESAEIVDIDKIRSLNHQASVLTQDENIVIVSLAVQYRIRSAEDYLFNVRAAEGTVKDATETSLREIIGRSTMDYVITEGRDALVVSARPAIQDILDRYKTGIEVTSVNMKSADPPEEVRAAFNDATKAREDEVRLRNEAEAYANEVIPKARGGSARVLEEAAGYRQKVVAEATGEATRFSLLRAEFERAPQVTRDRLYLETMEQVLGSSTKVIVDTKGGNNVLYLPLDRMVPQMGSDTAVAPRTIVRPEPTPSSDDVRTRDSLRARERR